MLTGRADVPSGGTGVRHTQGPALARRCLIRVSRGPIGVALWVCRCAFCPFGAMPARRAKAHLPADCNGYVCDSSHIGALV